MAQAKQMRFTPNGPYNVEDAYIRNIADKLHAMWQVLSVFAAAPDLVNMLREVETAYNAMLNQQPGWMDSPYAEFLPFISEQARDWEAAATVDNTGSSPTQVAFRL